MTTELNRRAWNIRRISAKRLNCGVMDVLWGECLRMARKAIEHEAMHRDSLVIHKTWRELNRTREVKIVTPFNSILLVLNVVVWYAVVTM